MQFVEEYQYGTRSSAARIPTIRPTDINLEGSLEELTRLLETWNVQHPYANYDPIPTLTEIAVLIENSMESYLKEDPDPLDDRHPCRTHPHAAYGNLLKHLFKDDHFMNKLVISYLLTRDQPAISVAAARLLLNCVPGLDSNVIFAEPEDFVPQLYNWATHSDNEYLQAYSMGLLSAALEVQENASKHRSFNAQLIPVALARLKCLKVEMENERASAKAYMSPKKDDTQLPTTFSSLHSTTHANTDNNDVAQRPSSSSSSVPNGIKDEKSNSGDGDVTLNRPRGVPMRNRSRAIPATNGGGDSPPRKKRKYTNNKNISPEIPHASSLTSLDNIESSNSKWTHVQPYIIGTHKLYPLTPTMHQRLILQFLGPTGEYQDLLALAYEGNAMELILDYIDLEKTGDVRLTFDALRYLTSLFVHRKFAMEFVSRGGVAALLKVPRTSMASVGVATAFYYLSYNDDVMEKVCQLDAKLVAAITEYQTWCLEHSYESGMASSCMFFTHSLFYRPILENFDRSDGLRKLYNYVSTLTLFNDVSIAADDFDLSEEQLHTSTQTVRNACAAFRSYMSAHLYVKLEQIKKTVGNKMLLAGCSYPSALHSNLPSYKSMQMTDENHIEGVVLLMTALRASTFGWKPVEEARKLGLVSTLLTIIVCSQDWEQPSGNRMDMCNNALETLLVCACLPKVQHELCETYQFTHSSADGYSVLLDLAEGLLFDEPDLRIPALNILICVVSVPMEFAKMMNRAESLEKLNEKKDGKHSKYAVQPMETLEKVWKKIRENSGILVLSNMVRTQTPVALADELRTCAVRTLCGLAKNEEVRQILSKSSLIASNELQSLMRDPVLQDHRAEHISFCKEAKRLIEIVTQRKIQNQLPNPRDLTQEKLLKSYIVSNTRITYNEKELLQLVHGHLIKKGLVDTAAELMREADLPSVPASRVAATPSKLPPLPSTRSFNISARRSLRLGIGPSSSIGSLAGLTSNHTLSSSDDSVFVTPNSTAKNNRKSSAKCITSGFPRRLHLKSTPSTRIGQVDKNGLRPCKGLDDIVTEYFRVQHSMCNNPVTTCPPFSLFYPHHCPEPKSLGVSPFNVVRRFNNRDIIPFKCHPRRTIYDERYVFSRFRPGKLISEHEEMYTSCAFSIDDEHLITGMFTGDVYWMNMETGLEECSTACHSSAITSIVPDREGSLLLTSSAYVRPLSSVWRLGDTQEHMYDIDSDFYIQFANLSSDKIVGNSDNRATIYDVETGRGIMNFQAAGDARYFHNKASFSPDDKIIMNDGHIWDVRTSTLIHTFDQLNRKNAGCFHPHGNEIIINTEVWDVRTFRCLHTIPVLDQCRISFNSTGNIIYALTHAAVEETYRNTYLSSFKTLDSSDYSVITTVDTKKNILDMCCDHSDRYMAVVEKVKKGESEPFMLNDESIIRTYEIGKRRDAEDDVEDDGDEEGAESRADDDDDSDNMTSLGSDGSDDDIRSSEGVFDAISRLAGGTNSDIEDDDGSSSMDGWEVASNQHEGGGEDDDDDDDGDSDIGNDGHGVDDLYTSSSSSSEDEPMGNDNGDDEDDLDETYQGGDDDRHPSNSSTTLNPHLRRQRRRPDGR